MLYSLPDCSHSICYPQSNRAPLVVVPEWVGLCTVQAPVGLSNDLSCEAGSLSCCRPNPHRCFQSGLFPCVGALGYVVCFTPCHSSWFSVHECGAAGSASGQTACPVCPTVHQSLSLHCHESPLSPGARLRPAYLSGCMFLFYLLGVRLPCHSIFCQFWLWEEAQCVYLRRHLGSQYVIFLNMPIFYFTKMVSTLFSCYG